MSCTKHCFTRNYPYYTELSIELNTANSTVPWARLHCTTNCYSGGFPPSGRAGGWVSTISHFHWTLSVEYFTFNGLCTLSDQCFTLTGLSSAFVLCSLFNDSTLIHLCYIGIYQHNSSNPMDCPLSSANTQFHCHRSVLKIALYLPAGQNISYDTVKVGYC